MKTFIISPHNIDILDHLNALTALNDDLNICKTFVSEKNCTGIIGKHMFGLDIDDIVLSFKNNALLYIDYKDDSITGMTLDDFDLSDIIPVTSEHFNMIPDKYLLENDVLIIWLTTKNYKSSKDKEKDVLESKYVYERIDNLSLATMYFLDEEPEGIAKTILEYVYGDEENRRSLIEENS